MADAQTQTAAPAFAGVDFQGDDFAALLEREFRPRSDDLRSEVEQAVQTLAQQALAQTALVGDDVMRSIGAMIAEIDHRLSAQINQILHHADFQKLESAWRGLHHLVNNTETDEML